MNTICTDINDMNRYEQICVCPYQLIFLQFIWSDMDQYARIETAQVFARVCCFFTANCCTYSYNEACRCKQCILRFKCRQYLCISVYMCPYLCISVDLPNNGMVSVCSLKVLSLLNQTYGWARVRDLCQRSGRIRTWRVRSLHVSVRVRACICAILLDWAGLSWILLDWAELSRILLDWAGSSDSPSHRVRSPGAGR